MIILAMISLIPWFHRSFLAYLRYMRSLSIHLLFLSIRGHSLFSPILVTLVWYIATKVGVVKGKVTVTVTLRHSDFYLSLAATIVLAWTKPLTTTQYHLGSINLENDWIVTVFHKGPRTAPIRDEDLEQAENSRSLLVFDVIKTDEARSVKIPTFLGI